MELFWIGVAGGVVITVIGFLWFPVVRTLFLDSQLDPTRPSEGVWITPRQMASRLKQCSDAELLWLSKRILLNAVLAAECFQQNHEGYRYQATMWRDRCLELEAFMAVLNPDGIKVSE
jgi:hypothetical protein